jgi:SAM-dependent methyltransferase
MPSLRADGRSTSGIKGGKGPADEGLPTSPPAEADEYIERNLAAWTRWARESALAGRQAWSTAEFCWGLWNTPESELKLVEEIEPGAAVIELGCGTAEVSAWIARRGFRPAAVDFSRAMLEVAERLQHEFGPSFPLILANAEQVPYDHDSFDVAVSEYGASLWCDPRRWLPEANRLLRPGGRLVFVTNGALLITCTSADGGQAGDRLVRSYFGSYRVEFPEDDTVEFHPTHSQWIQLLGATGFALENLIEVRPPHGAKPRLDFASVEWARHWPSEEIWVARKF